MTPLCYLSCHPQVFELQYQSPRTVTSAKASVLCGLCLMKLNTSKTKTMIVSRSHTMHPKLPLIPLGGTVLKQSDELDLLVGTFDAKMTFYKYLRSVPSAAFQWICILRKPLRVFHDRLFLERSGFCAALFGVLFCSVVLGFRYSP